MTDKTGKFEVELDRYDKKYTVRAKHSNEKAAVKARENARKTFSIIIEKDTSPMYFKITVNGTAHIAEHIKTGCVLPELDERLRVKSLHVRQTDDKDYLNLILVIETNKQASR